MPWIDALPDVQTSDFQTRRDQIEQHQVEACKLEKLASRLHSKAYFSILSAQSLQTSGREVESMLTEIVTLLQRADRLRQDVQKRSRLLEQAANLWWSPDVVKHAKRRFGQR